MTYSTDVARAGDGVESKQSTVWIADIQSVDLEKEQKVNTVTENCT